eukprot:6460133-Amphidinium_carterae.1
MAVGWPRRTIHTFSQSGNDTYNPDLPMYLLCWRQTMPYILSESDNRAQSHNNVHYRRAEDISFEFNPLYNGTTPRSINIKQLICSTVGTWEVADWSKATDMEFGRLVKGRQWWQWDMLV